MLTCFITLSWFICKTEDPCVAALSPTLRLFCLLASPNPERTTSLILTVRLSWLLFLFFSSRTTVLWADQECLDVLFIYLSEGQKNSSWRPLLPLFGVILKWSDRRVLPGCSFCPPPPPQKSEGKHPWKPAGGWGGGLAESEERGEILCQSEMSDMRLSSLTWHVLERPWLSADSEGRDGKKDSKDGVWKKPGSVALLSLTTQINWALFESKKSSVWFLPLANGVQWMG